MKDLGCHISLVKSRVLREKAFRLSSCQSHPKGLQIARPKKNRSGGEDSRTSIFSVTLTANPDCAEHMWHLPDIFPDIFLDIEGEPKGCAEDHTATPGQGVQYLLSASARETQDLKLLPGCLGILEAFY